MNRSVISAFITLFLLFISGCLREDNPSINKAVWSSSDPLDIPLKKRRSELSEKNKAINPSFESGRYFKDHINTYKIDGWKEIGKNEDEIKWVDLNDSRYSTDDAHSGIHSIKITNRYIDETEEQGVGVISDFIKVIPGNYSLTYYIKLKNICSYKNRFGNRLIDAINIRVFYYDKNKIKINGDMINPEDGTKFDNEFKAFPFSGFWQIDSLDWIKARGISHKFPFMDGDIPDETRYVRLFFGLKGTGTMWIDDVSFQYTSQNFSLSERFEKYRNKDFQPFDLIVPKPQIVHPGEKLTCYNPKNPSKQPLIIIPENAKSLTHKAALNLKKRIEELATTTLKDSTFTVPVVSGFQFDKLAESSLVFSIGDNSVNRKNAEIISDSTIQSHPEGFVIKRLNDSSNIIAIKGNNAIGDYYAVHTLKQLFSETDFNYYHADIVDYPEYQNRGLLISQNDSGLTNTLETFHNFRFNKAFRDANSSDDIGEFLKMLQNVSKLSKESQILKTGIALNPYLPPFNKNESFNNDLSSRDYEQVRKYILSAKKYSVEDIILRMDNVFNINDSCNCVFNFEKFTNSHLPYRSILDIHTHFVNSLNGWVSESTNIYFLPIWNRTDCITRSQGRGELYLKELFKKIPSEVNYLWTGATEKPFITDNVEVARIKKIIGKDPVFFTKNINPYSGEKMECAIEKYSPGKIRIGSIFEHFDLVLPDKFYESCNQQTLLCDIRQNDLFGKIKIATLGNYLWNADDYNSDFSLFSTLVYFYGKSGAFFLIEFNELYHAIYEMSIKMNNQGPKKKFDRAAEEYVRQMDLLLDKFNNLFQNPELKKELETRRNKIENFYEQSVAN